MTTVIDSDSYAAAGIEILFFPGGEPHVKLPETLKGEVLLHLKLRTWNAVGIAACLIDAAWRTEGITWLKAFIPYFPGARQERSEGLYPLTLGIMQELLASKCDTAVFDLHAPNSNDIDYIDHNFMPSDLLLGASSVMGIIAPDAGAVNRAALFRDRFYPDAQIIECTKERDPLMGGLSHFTMPRLEFVGKYLIVDDICDGGGTFNLLVDAFDQSHIGRMSELSMFVSHGIFSKGLDAINPRIRHIATTDSWCQLPNSERLTVIPLLPQLSRQLGIV